MEVKTIKKDSAEWANNDPTDTLEAECNAHVREDIAQGKAQFDAGQQIPAAQVWEELCIE